MTLALTAEETQLHSRACALARQHRETETQLCHILREIGQSQLYLKLGYARLFTYATAELKLTKAVAYAAIAVARQTGKIPELKAVIDEGQLSVSKASRLVSSLTTENASELIGFALTHTSEEIDEEVARRNPEKPKRDHSRHVGNDKVAVSGQISLTTHKLMKRAKSLLASKGNPTGLDGVLRASLETWLDRNDPLRKAQRAKESKATAREADATQASNAIPAGNDSKKVSQAGHDPNHSNSSANFCVNRKTRGAGRDEPLSTGGRRASRDRRKRAVLKARVQHEVTLRTGDCCTFVNERGERCTEDRWLHRHHIVPLSQGGSDEAANITLLCSAHHALVHQLSLPLEGQITWLRAPRVAYHA